MLDVPSKCRWIAGVFLPVGFMVVSAVDLLYVFGRSLVLSDRLPSSFSSVGEALWDLVSAR